MSHAKNKVEWCIRKAPKEVKESGKHRGLVIEKPDFEKSESHIRKAEHYLKATEYLKKGNFSDLSASTAFYSMYHCLLAIAVRFGYESRNQECTFALISSLIDDGKIKFDKKVLEKISSFDLDAASETTITGVRERYQYGLEFSIEDGLYKELYDIAKEVISVSKVIIK